MAALVAQEIVVHAIDASLVAAIAKDLVFPNAKHPE
jgi:hypothetical protein